jgi:hypothetical protein
MSIQIYLFKNIPKRIPKTFFSLSTWSEKKISLTAFAKYFYNMHNYDGIMLRPRAMKIPWEACSAGVWLTAMWKFYFFYEIIIHFSLSLSLVFLFWGITPTTNFLEALNWEMLSWIILVAISHRNTMTEWWLDDVAMRSCPEVSTMSRFSVMEFQMAWHRWEKCFRETASLFLNNLFVLINLNQFEILFGKY